MNHREHEKSKVYITTQIVDYIPNSVVSKNILEKLTGNISVLSFDDKEGLSEKISPFDTVAQIIEGKAEIIIDGASYFMEEGECIIIPAHKSHSIKGNKCFKMIVTIIKAAVMNNLNTISVLTKKIFKKTVEIQKEFPELYELLDETPLFFSEKDKNITIKDLRQYLISLIIQQKSFEKGTNKKNDLQ